MFAMSKSGLPATNAFHASKPGPGVRPTPSPVFITSNWSMRSGILHRQREPEQAAPVLHDQRDALEVQRFDEAHQHRAMEIERVDRIVYRLVGAAEAEQVRCNDAMARGRKDRDHLAVQIAQVGWPCRHRYVRPLAGSGRSSR